MKMYIKLVVLFSMIVILSQTVHAQVNFEQVNDKDLIKVIFTGQGYFKRPPVDYTRDNGNVYYSKDKLNWRIVDNSFGKSVLFNQNTPYSQVIETDSMFIVCDTSFSKGESFKRNSVITLLDKEFNIIKEMDMERISDISYINGVCYINKYLEYWSNIPHTGISNAVIKQTSYYSTDFENWFVYVEDGGIPIVHNGKELFLKNNLKLSPNDISTFSGEYARLSEQNESVYISSNGEIEEEIIYESIDFTNLVQLQEYLFAIPVRRSQYIEDLNNYFAVSKDGVYFTFIKIPIDKNTDGFQITGLWEIENGDIVIRIHNNDYDASYKFSTSDLEKNIQNSDIYVQFQDKILGFETPPVIEDGSTLVPMRFLFEQMGADVEWNQETQTATATLNNTAVTFSIDDTEASVNNTPATMDVPARLINDKTMVPLRFLSEEMGFDVSWDADSRTAIIE